MDHTAVFAESLSWVQVLFGAWITELLEDYLAPAQNLRDAAGASTVGDACKSKQARKSKLASNKGHHTK
ncbi:unnamed protein product [Caretta caretta]